MLHTAAGPKIDSENEDSEEIPLIILGSGLSISSIWDCLFFWTNSLLSDLCEGPHSISFYKYIDENGWLVTYSTYFLYDDKSCSIINFYSRKLKVYFSKDSCATGNDLSKESIFFLQQKGCMYHDKKAWWRDIFMIQLQSFISQDCDFPWDASKSLLFPAPNSKFLSLTYDLHLLTCISVLIGIRLANKGCWKSAFI